MWKTRVTGIDEFGPQAIAGPSVTRPKERAPRPQRPDEEDAEYRLAIEASKYEAEEDKKRRAKNAGTVVDDDDDLAKAIRLSKEEEELRRRELEDQNAASLFDDTPTPAQPQATGWNQGYQQQPAVDWFGNPLAQQPQSTGYLNNQYAQQPQPTGLQNGSSNGFGAQPTGFDQFQQQQQQQPQSQPNFLQQQNTIQPQQTAFTNNPYGQPQSNDIFGQQSPQQPFAQAGSHNPWASNQQQQQQASALKPMPTGSNNPFAQGFGQQQPTASKTNVPTLNTLYEQPTATQFSQPTQPNPIANYHAPAHQQQVKPQNPQHAKLNALLASGEGQDTFGNVGDLRIPSQHTAPGTFVNSGGVGIDRLRAAQTGNNPFFQQQVTGAGPTQGGFGQQVPAQTGPAGSFGSSFGQQNNNPFGARPGPPQQSNSLIDL